MRQILKMIGIWATAGSFLFPACQPVPEVPVLSYPLPEQVRTDGETVFRVGKDSVSRVYLIKDILCKVYNRGEKSFALALENLEPGFPSRSYVKYGGLNEDEMMLTLASRGPEGILLEVLVVFCKSSLSEFSFWAPVLTFAEVPPMMFATYD